MRYIGVAVFSAINKKQSNDRYERDNFSTN